MSPTSEKHDAGLRKQSAPTVQHVLQSNHVMMQTHTDERKTDKGWAQFEEDCQGTCDTVFPMFVSAEIS